MKLNMTKLGGAILGLLLFVGINVVSSTTAQAQYPYDRDNYRRQQRERERELRRQQEQQARQGGWYDQYGNWHSNNNNGYYNNGYYNNGSYRGRSYDGYPNYGGGYDLRQTALNAGYNEGLKQGRNDRRSGRYNPTRYGNTLKDYNSRMGDRAAYQSYYMQAFQNGYADGYRYGY